MPYLIIYHIPPTFVNIKGASFMTSLIQLCFLLQLSILNVQLIFSMEINKTEFLKINQILKNLQRRKIITKSIRIAFWDLVNEVGHFHKFHIEKQKLVDLLEVQHRQVERYLHHLEEIGLVFRDYTTHNINDREVGNTLDLTLIHPKEILSFYLFHGTCNIRKHLIEKRSNCTISDIVCISDPDLYLKNYRFNQALEYAVKPELPAAVKPELPAAVKPELPAAVSFLAKIQRNSKGIIQLYSIKPLGAIT